MRNERSSDDSVSTWRGGTVDHRKTKWREGIEDYKGHVNFWVGKNQFIVLHI